jgi:hypothetical protein
VLHIFSLLPVDCRLRCIEVCRGWRSVLLERSLWTQLDLRAASGVRVPTAYAMRGVGQLNALLRCAAARTGGALHSLHVDTTAVSYEALMEVVTANAGALRELHAHDDVFQGFHLQRAEALLVAAPQLHVFATSVDVAAGVVAAVRRALRNEAPFGPLRVRHLRANLRGVDEDGVVAFAVDVAAHASLARLTLISAWLDAPAALDAVVDAALARRMHAVSLEQCHLRNASAPALARLLGGGTLTKLRCTGFDVLNEPATLVLLAAALRANATLTSLSLIEADVFDDPAAAAELLGALTGHASLRVLCLQHNGVDAASRAAVGAALGALVAANAPALTKLDVSQCGLGDDGLRPLFQALPANTHLLALSCFGNGITEAFARDVLLPAVRANTSLRTLHVWPHDAISEEAARIMSNRATA